MIKKAILFKEENFPLISFLTTGYWLGEETLTYYNDMGKSAQGDLLGKLVLVEHCKTLILEELESGLYDVEFAYVEVIQSDFNRKYNTEGLKNWIGWTTKHKKFVLESENFNYIKKTDYT